MSEFLGAGQDYPKHEEIAPEACKKGNKKLRKLQDRTIFLFGELYNNIKTFVF